MKIKKIKKLVQVGGAVGMIVPKYWLDHHGLVKGDKITLMISDEITIAPTVEEDENKKSNKGKKDEK